MVLTLCAASGRAETAPLSETGPPPSFPPLSAAFGGHAALSFGDRCTREATDLVTCTPNGALMGVHLEPSLRLAALWSLGLRGAVSFPGHGETWWQATAEGRFHALGAAHPDLWMGVGVGVLARSQKVAGDGLGSPTTLTREAPLLAATSGVDFAVTRFFAVGPELRVLFVPFGPVDPLPSRGASLGTTTAIGLGVNVTASLGN